MAAFRYMWKAAMRKGEAEFKRALLTKIEDKLQQKKIPLLHQPSLPRSYCDHLRHSAIGKVTGVRVGAVVQAFANIVIGLIIAFSANWKLTLVLIVILPCVAIAQLTNVKLSSGMSKSNQVYLEQAGKIATEVLGNAKTITSLMLEEYFQRSFRSILQTALNRLKRQAHVAALTFAISQACVYFLYALAFYYGATLIEDGETSFGSLMKVFTALVFSAMALGQLSAFSPDVGKADNAAKKIFSLLDSVPSRNAALDIGYKPTEGTFRNDIHFQDINFTYLNRPNIRVLQDFSATIKQGQTVALVGSSGCGKSTVISLLEQFYSCDSGHVLLDNYDINELNTQWLRAQIGLVSQEPSLFNCSIADNIAYGDNSRAVGMDEIIRAARKANIHSFIEGLPKGYETNSGDKGTQLSGGQKQRIAIARALIRNPKTLLLDEATSALDTENERIVQEALDNAKEGRTCIVIAHRLSTIVNSDNIVVIDKGTVVEQGTHKELMATKGTYYNLQMKQNRKR